jgi:thioredoxin reductase
MSTSTQAQLPVAVIGAGPVGLAAAAHLLELGIEPMVLESANSVGANLLDYGHVRLFSPWRYNLCSPMTKALERTGWKSPDLDELPLARDIVERVLKPYAALPEVSGVIHLGHRVLSISREGFDKVKSEGRASAPYVIRVATRDGEIDIRARAVIDSSGTWTSPNPLGANGLPAIGEEEAAAQIHYGIPDALGPAKARYVGKRVLVVGAGHSAANALLALAELTNQGGSTQLVWAIRSNNLNRVFGGGDADALPARGRLGTELRKLQENGRLELVPDFRISAISRRDGKLVVHALGADGRKKHVEGIDEIICATGQRPDMSLTSELRVKFDPWLESAEALGPLIDPNLHSCGTVRPHGHRELSHPEQGFYTIGVKSYGRAPTFLMTTGFEQARSVIAAIAGDLEAADRVELILPETGVCSSNLGDAGGSCCGVESSSLVTIDEPAPPTTVEAGASCCGAPTSAATKVADRATTAGGCGTVSRGKPLPIAVKDKSCC